MELGRRQSDRSFNESQDLLAVVTADGVLKIVNAAWGRALGYRLDELIGRPFFKVVDDHDRVTALKLVNPRLATPGSPVVELALRCKDLSYRSFLWNRRYIVAEQAVFISGRDITERKKMETTQNLRLYDVYAQARKIKEPSGSGTFPSSRRLGQGRSVYPASPYILAFFISRRQSRQLPQSQKQIATLCELRAPATLLYVADWLHKIKEFWLASRLGI